MKLERLISQRQPPCRRPTNLRRTSELAKNLQEWRPAIWCGKRPISLGPASVQYYHNRLCPTPPRKDTVTDYVLVQKTGAEKLVTINIYVSVRLCNSAHAHAV